VTEAYSKLALEAQRKQFEKNRDQDPLKAPDALQLISVMMMRKRGALQAASDARAAGALELDMELDMDPVADDHVDPSDMLDDVGFVDVDENVISVLGLDLWSDVDLGVGESMLNSVYDSEWAQEMDLELGWVR
jgi:hypothetical protein